jgi:hypothetical protein
MAKEIQDLGIALDATSRHVGLSHLRRYDEQEIQINNRRDRVS